MFAASRTALWASLSSRPPVDLAVIGGGATGLGVALDAALRGHSVVLLEAHDFGSGTSSRSTKLLHGGVRYLAQGHWSLVREALRERRTVMQLAPHLTSKLPFVMPSRDLFHHGLYGMGLEVYQWLSGAAALGRNRWWSADATRARLPGLHHPGLVGGVEYWDGQFDDARLALALARTIERAGGRPVHYADVTDVRPSAGEAGEPGGFDVHVADRLADRTAVVRVRCVVNATGVWVDRLRQQAARQAGQAVPAASVSASQGVHVVINRAHWPGDRALLVPKTSDGRVFFIIPWLGAVLLGTTDTPTEDLAREPRPHDAELDFILREANAWLGKPLSADDIQSVWVGLRPLGVAPHRSALGPTASVSREHTVLTDPSGLISVTGGKWTTYRRMADDVLAVCVASGRLPPRDGADSRFHRLVGAPDDHAAGVALSAPPGPHLYGTEWARVLECPGVDEPLGWGLTTAMVRFAARFEYACTVEDMLARRWRVLYVDARLARSMAPRVAELLHEETGLDPQLDSFLQRCDAYLPHKAIKANSAPYG